MTDRRKQADAPRGRLPATLRFGRSGLHGVGVFTRDFVPAGEQLLEYVGERITKAEAKRREEARRKRAAAGEPACVYIFELNARHDLDGDVLHNPARRVNHSCAPNCEAQSDGRRIWLVALRDLAPGEELTYDYGFPFADARLHPCRCGAAECAGFIVAKSQRWRLRR